MREIKFRAKTVTTDSWVYGHYAFVDGFHVMYEGTSNPVIIKANTLGQYTDLKDVNSVEIYEGDVAAVEIIKGVKIKVPVKFENGSFNIHEIPGGYGFRDTVYPLGALFLRDFGIEVIGNVYENPELLVVDSNV